MGLPVVDEDHPPLGAETVKHAGVHRMHNIETEEVA